MALTDDITDPRLAKALAHPLRLEILRHLGDRTASPSEIAAEIGAPLTNVSYHVRKLRALGLIKLVRKTPKRGVIEHYYSAKPRPTVTKEAWAGTPDIVKEALASSSTRRSTATILQAAVEGGFNHTSAHFVDQRHTLDERGWGEVGALLEKTYDELDKIEAAARDRIESKGDSTAIKAALVVAFFEPPEGDVKAGAGRPAAKPASAKSASA